MPGIPLEPLRFEPILRRLIWGGRRLGTVLHKAIGEGNDMPRAGSFRIIAMRSASSGKASSPEPLCASWCISKALHSWGLT